MTSVLARRRARRSQTRTRPADTRPGPCLPSWYQASRTSRHPVRDFKAQALDALIWLLIDNDYDDHMEVRDLTARPYPTVEFFVVSGPRWRAPAYYTRRHIDLRQHGGRWWYTDHNGPVIEPLDHPDTTLESIRLWCEHKFLQTGGTRWWNTTQPHNQPQEPGLPPPAGWSLPSQ